MISGIREWVTVAMMVTSGIKEGTPVAMKCCKTRDFPQKNVSKVAVMLRVRSGRKIWVFIAQWVLCVIRTQVTVAMMVLSGRNVWVTVAVCVSGAEENERWTVINKAVWFT